MALSLSLLEQEKDQLKERLRAAEIEQREAEAALKHVRQKELRIKRELEALSTLIDLAQNEGD